MARTSNRAPDGRGAQIEATIALNGSITGAISTGRHAVMGIGMSAAWTAATLTFQVDPGDGTYRDVYDYLGNEYTFQAAAGRYIPVDQPQYFAGAQNIKIRSGTSGVPVAQLAARTLMVVTGPVFS